MSFNYQIMTSQDIIAHSQYTIKNYYLIQNITKLAGTSKLIVNELLIISEEKEKKK